jgi:hypothetical protein
MRRDFSLKAALIFRLPPPHWHVNSFVAACSTISAAGKTKKALLSPVSPDKTFQDSKPIGRAIQIASHSRP